MLGTRNLTQILNDRDSISEEMVDSLQVEKCRGHVEATLMFIFNAFVLFLFALDICLRKSFAIVCHLYCPQLNKLLFFLQAGVNKIGVAIDRVELRQIGLPRDMQVRR